MTRGRTLDSCALESARRAPYLRATRWVAIALAVVSLTPAAARPVPPGRVGVLDPLDLPLRPDPALIAGVLDNGMRYIVRRHGGTAGCVALRLEVEAGSLDEQENERGAAFFAAFLRAAASAERPAGEAVMLLGESLPPPLRALEVQVEHHSASFTVTLPIADDKALFIGLRFLLDLASLSPPSDGAALAARPRVLAERGARMSSAQRLLVSLLEQAAPGSRLARHPPIPDELEICNLEGPDLRRFIKRCYQPFRMTVLAVGDADPERMAAAIRGTMAKAAPIEVDPPMASPSEPLLTFSTRSAVVVDPSIVGAVAEAISWHRAPPAVRTVRSWRQSLVERVASAGLKQRLAPTAAPEGSAVKGAEVRMGLAPGPVHLALASVSGAAGEWRSLVQSLSAVLNGVRQSGLNRDDLVKARRTVLNELLAESTRHASKPLATVLDRLGQTTWTSEVPLSPEDEAALAERLLPTISEREVSRALAERFDAENMMLVLFIPPDGVEVTAGAVLEAAESAGCVEESEGVHVRSETRAGPETTCHAGRIDSLSLDPRAAVTTATLSNGVRVHARPMADPGGRATLVIEAIDPTPPDAAADSAGLEVLEAAWAAPASKSHPSWDLRRLLSEIGADLRMSGTGRGVRVEIGCSRASLETVMRLVHSILSEPLAEAGAISRWKWVMNQRLSAKEVDPAAAADDTLRAILHPRRGALDTMSRSQIERITAEAVQRRLEAFMSRTRLDAAIAGDIDRFEALDLASRYLGSLPPRPGTHEARIGRCPRPVLCERRVELKPGAPQAVVLVAVHGAIPPRGGDAEALDVAARILASRLNAQRADGQPFGRIVAVRHLHADASASPGLLAALSAADPGSVDALAAFIGRTFTALAVEGPNEPELIRARAEAVDEFDSQAADPAWWARSLASMDAFGGRPADLLAPRERLASMTAETVRRTLAEHDPAVCCGGDRLVIIASPAKE